MIRTTMKGFKIIAVKYSQKNIKTYQKYAFTCEITQNYLNDIPFAMDVFKLILETFLTA